MMEIQVFKIRLQSEYLQNDQSKINEFVSQHKIIKYESGLITDRQPYWSVLFYYERTSPKAKSKSSLKFEYSDEEILNTDELKILDALKYWRTEKAKEDKLPAYFIASNKELVSVAKYRPSKVEELKDIKGFGKHKIENYGSQIIEIIDSV